MTKVSVLMPVYKTPEKFLREAIESILAQTFRDFEFLILDDCPADDREKIVKLYADKRIKYAKNPQNMGISASRNKLIDMAQGEYLAIFDHDDISLPTRLEKEVAYLDEHTECGVVSCTAEIFGAKHKIKKYPEYSHDIKVALMHSCAMFHSAAMVRKSILIDNNIQYEEEFSPAEDYRLWSRLIPFSEFYNIPEVLLKYREHATNTSKTQRNKMLEATYKMYAYNQVNHPELYAEFQIRTNDTVRVRLFGFMPFLRIVRKDERMKVYLFDKLPLLTLKFTNKMS